LKIKLPNNFILLFLVFTHFFGSSYLRSSEIEETFFSENNYSKLNKNYLYKPKKDFYILGPGDKLLIYVSSDFKDIKTRIDGAGSITIPFLNTVFVEGLTVPELRYLLQEQYRKYIKFPEIRINIDEYRPVKILIEGEVVNPGLHTLKGSMMITENLTNKSILKTGDELSSQESFFLQNNKNLTQETPKNINYYFPSLYDAIRVSGGLTRFSDISQIKIIRKNKLSSGGGQIMTTVNFEKLFKERDNSQNIRIFDGDVIVLNKLENPKDSIIPSSIAYNINPKFVRVQVAGRVNNPGVIILGKSGTLNDAIDLAGGTKILKGYINYISFNNDGTVEKRKISYRSNRRRGSLNNPYLKQGDLIYVGSTLLSNTSEVISEITQPFQGIYSAYRLIELFSE